MISIRFPSILAAVRQLSYGLLPVWIQPDGRFALVIKAPKEAILTARLKQEIKCYLVPDENREGHCLGLITCFFDDHDQPITITSPLFAGDAMLDDVACVLGQEEFDLHLFDEHDRELLGACVRLKDADRFRQAVNDCTFPMLDIAQTSAIIGQMQVWFGSRSAVDDAHAFVVSFGKRLMPDDLAIIDVSGGDLDFRDADHGVSIASLDRPDAGPPQERDIAGLLRRVFGHDAVVLNPLRDDTGTELADVVIFTDEMVLLVQAKDSPNTEAALNRSIERKRATIRGHIKKGARQLQGAIELVQSGRAKIRSQGQVLAITADGRVVRGAVVVRELFEDDYRACSVPVLGVAKACHVSCAMLDYSALYLMVSHLPTAQQLIDGMDRLHAVALLHGEYPKPRFLLVPAAHYGE